MNVKEIKGEEWQDLLKFLAQEMKNKKTFSFPFLIYGLYFKDKLP